MKINASTSHFWAFASRYQHGDMVAIEKYLVKLVDAPSFWSRFKLGDIFQNHVDKAIKATKGAYKLTIIFHYDMHSGADCLINQL